MCCEWPHSRSAIQWPSSSCRKPVIFLRGTSGFTIGGGFANSQRDAGIALIGGADRAQAVECLGKELVEQLQPLQVSNHSGDGEVELVDALRKRRAEPALVILHR